MGLKETMNRVNGMGWIIQIVYVTLACAALYYGLDRRIMALASEIRANAVADSSRSVMRNQQLRFLWDKAQTEHESMWEAIGVRRAKHKARPPEGEESGNW